jgi:predicted dehydrogenase
MSSFNQTPKMPQRPRPICAIGAGGIMRHAHLPAYDLAEFPVVSVFDVNPESAESLALDFGIKTVSESVGHMVDQFGTDVVYDLATPASHVSAILRVLPDQASVLIQKPMGEDLAQADEILEVCREKQLRAAVNFQLRTAPYSLAARDIIAQGLIGDVLEIEAKVCVHTPWEIWDFLELAPRMEIVYHSIHYLDLIRSLIGDPVNVKANTIKHPLSPNLHSSRSAIILEYNNNLRALVNTYHGHKWGTQEQESYIKIEGTKGAIKFQMGLNMNYPDGLEDWLIWTNDEQSDWQKVPLTGSWFPHAFIGTMAGVQPLSKSATTALARPSTRKSRSLSRRGSEPVRPEKGARSATLWRPLSSHKNLPGGRRASRSRPSAAEDQSTPERGQHRA